MLPGAGGEGAPAQQFPTPKHWLNIFFSWQDCNTFDKSVLQQIDKNTKVPHCNHGPDVTGHMVRHGTYAT